MNEFIRVRRDSDRIIQMNYVTWTDQLTKSFRNALVVTYILSRRYQETMTTQKAADALTERVH